MRAGLPPIGLAPLTVLDCPPVEMVKLAASIGYQTIGLRLFPAYPGSPVYPVPVGSTLMREMCSVLDGTGVEVFDIEFILVDPDFEVDSRRAGLESAAALGAKRINIAGDDDDLHRLADNIRALADEAANLGLAVDIEPMRWRKVNSFQRAIEVMRTVDRANVGLLTDCLHLDRTGYSPAELATINPQLCRALQLCDAPAKRPESMEALLEEARNGRLLPGHGALPLLDILASMPCDVAISIECPMPTSIPIEVRAQCCFDAANDLLRRHQARSPHEG